MNRQRKSPFYPLDYYNHSFVVTLPEFPYLEGPQVKGFHVENPWYGQTRDIGFSIEFNGTGTQNTMALMYLFIRSVTRGVLGESLGDLVFMEFLCYSALPRVFLENLHPTVKPWKLSGRKFLFPKVTL